MKPTICLIHGLFGNLNAAEILDAFGKEVAVLAPDLIGYGTFRNRSVYNLSLDDQADHIISNIEADCSAPVHLVGHSIGGAVAALVAHSRPDLVKSLISVEGNFTLKDAFWSAEIARKKDRDVEEIITAYRADPDAWMDNAIQTPSDLSSRLARDWLENQPATTIKAQAAAVVSATGEDRYLRDLRSLMEAEMPVHLISGSRSASGWDTPVWANQLCTTRINIPGAGHLMMVEAPDRFVAAILACIGITDSLSRT